MTENPSFVRKISLKADKNGLRPAVFLQKHPILRGGVDTKGYWGLIIKAL